MLTLISWYVPTTKKFKCGVTPFVSRTEPYPGFVNQTGFRFFPGEQSRTTAFWLGAEGEQD